MATHAILIQNRAQAMNIDALNRSAYCTYDLDNGNVFYLASLQGTTGCEVWAVTKCNGSTVDFWMAYSPEIVDVTAGTKKYRGIDPDPQDFYNSACIVFDAFRPEVGDILTLTGDAFTAAPSTNTYANSADNSWELVWGAAKTGSALSLKLLDTTHVSIPDGSIGTQRVTAYKCQVIANPLSE